MTVVFHHMDIYMEMKPAQTLRDVNMESVIPHFWVPFNVS